jgi:hypothetical protein
MSVKRKIQQARQRDKLGSRLGTIANKVNLVISRKWKTDEEIAQEAGLALRRARARLYSGASNGLYERHRVIRYRLRAGADSLSHR